MAYVEGFIVPVPKKKVKDYLRIARRAGRVWRDLGALEYRECQGDDLFPKGALSFAKMAKVKPSETVFFSWIVYKSKAHRKSVVAKVMKDPRLADLMDPKAMPFDMKRMAYGGFKVSVSL